MFHQPPPSEQHIASLPLRFVDASQQPHEVFIDDLLAIWVELVESGSLATLPPVPDIIGFANGCIAFLLIYHTNPHALDPPPGMERRSSKSPEPSSSSSLRRGCGKRWHPYPRPSSSTSRVFSHEDTSADTYEDQEPAPGSELETITPQNLIGCVYLSLSATQGSADIGIALRPDARGRGYGRAALTKVIRHAFDNLRMHRVVANVFGPGFGQDRGASRAAAQEAGTVCWVFEKLGFTPEGVNRRAGFSAADGTWRDVHVLAILDTDWVLLERRQSGRAGIQTPWDTLMERHEKERELMAEWMEHPSWGRLRRTGSTETIRGVDPEPEQELEQNSESDAPYTTDEDPAPGSSATGRFTFDEERVAGNKSPFFSNSSETESLYDEPALHITSPAPSSSVGVSPPASIISLPSDSEWRSVGPSLSSQPSAASTPSQSSWQELSPEPHAGQAPVTSPPAFSLDSGDEDMSFWDSDLESELEDGYLGAGLRHREGRHPDI